MRISKAILTFAQKAKQASKALRVAKTKEKNEALKMIAENLRAHQDTILTANKKDLQEARANGLPDTLLDRLSLENRLDAVISDIYNVTSLEDPVGEIIEERMLPNGLKLQKKRVPIGVLGVIYEARPNVTVDVASLVLKTGNAAILRGGKETLRTNKVLITVIQKALLEISFPEECIQLIPSKSRSAVKQMLKLDSYIDMIIPRGGAALHRFCLEESMIPVIVGGIGICHLFVDESADLEKAIEVIVNAKTQRPSVCNALDTLLVHSSIAKTFLLTLVSKLANKNVSFRLDPKAREILPKGNAFQNAKESDWQTEWLSLVLNIKIVESLEEAIEHVQKYSSGHSDGILTNTPSHAQTFVEAIDSGALYINASTRFTDGGQFGLGAEVAISTQKLHARGPMGLKELTTYKWIIEGNYHIREG